jgi:hypothetical protein
MGVVMPRIIIKNLREGLKDGAAQTESISRWSIVR